MNDQLSNKGAGLEVMKVKTVEILENGKEVEKEDDQQPIDKAPHELDDGKRHMENTESIITDGKKLIPKLEDLQVLELQNPDLVEKTVGDTDDLRIVTDVPRFEHAVPDTGCHRQWKCSMPNGQLRKGSSRAILTAWVHSFQFQGTTKVIRREHLSLTERIESVQCCCLMPSVLLNMKTFQANSDVEGKDGLAGTDLRLLPDAANIKKDECISTAETFKTNVNEVDGSASDQEEDGLAPHENMSFGRPDSLAPGQAEGLAHSDNTAKLNGIAPDVHLSNKEREGERVAEGNEKLGETLERMLESGNAQLGVIADLNGRVKDSERELSQKKRCKVKKKFQTEKGTPSH
ncbi:hypothetical protein BHE74_00036335 [Ensete ventricosum]|nr:hypothetical protein BHE74_00036335 [Ensete ventricosum]